MLLKNFGRRVQVAQEQLDLLRRHEALAPELRAPLREAIEGFSIALEELHVAQEELYQQNEELLEARQDLEAERRRYQELFDFAPDGYLVTDAFGIIQEANRAAMDLLNVRKDFLEGKVLPIFLAAEDREEFSTRLANMRRGKAQAGAEEWETKLKPRHGLPFPAALTVAPVHDEEGQLVGLRWLLRDITASRRARERERLLDQIMQDRAAIQEMAENLARERTTLQTIMENTHAQLAYLDPDFTFVRVNAAYARGAGYSPEDLIGRNHFDLFPDAENEAIFEGVRDIGRPVYYRARPFDYPGHPERGTTYWDWTLVPVKGADGKVERLVFSLLDVSELVRARQKVEELAARNQAILSNMTEGIIILDLEGNVVEMNAAALRLHQFDKAEEAQQHLLDYSHTFEIRDMEGRRLPVEEWPASRILHGENFTKMELKVRRADTGHTFFASYSGAAVLDKEGRRMLGVLTLHDITDRKKHEAQRERLLAQLAAQQAQLNAIIDNAPEAIIVTDPSSRIVLTNPATQRLFGQPLPHGQGLADQSDLTLCHPDGTAYEPQDLPLSRAALDGQVHSNLEMALLRPDGESRDMLVSTAPIRDGQGRVDGVVGVFQDITERKRIERALQLYMNRLQTLHQIDRAILAAESAEAIADIALSHIQQIVPCKRASLALFDLETGEATLLKTTAGNGTQIPSGWRGPIGEEWPLEQLKKGKIQVVEDIGSAEPVMPLHPALYAEGVRSMAHLPLIADGVLIGALNLGMPESRGPTAEQMAPALEMAYGLAVALRQIRLHDQVQQHADELEQEVAHRTAALRTSEKRLRTIFEGTAAGIALSDLEGNILETNRALQQMLGYSAKELASMSFADFTHPEDAAESVASYRDLVAGECTDYTLEKRYLAKDGQMLWANLNVALVRDTGGQPLYGVGMVQDITERKQMQEALLRAEKLAIAGQLGASLAHEINNPLQSVIGCLGLAENALGNGGDVSRYLEVARTELRRAARIVGQLRDLHHIAREQKKEPVDLNALLDEILLLSRKKCQEAGVEVVWDQAAGLPHLPAVPDRLRQVFLNLVLNALDAMEEGGTLRMSTQATDEPAGVRVVVADTGTGIAPDAVSQVFEPFYTTKPEGLGLGLFITQKVVEEHGGKIELESQYNRGSTFTVWLPA